MATAAQILANQANAQLSTGPKSEATKAVTRFNAVKTGLTGQTVLLPSDDAAEYQAHTQRTIARFKPRTDEERTLTQLISDTEWRLLRITSLESGIYAVGFRKLADLYPDEPNPVERRKLIEAEIQMAYRKDLSNIYLQETRLNRQLEKYSTQLKEIQNHRRSVQRTLLVRLEKHYNECKEDGIAFEVPEFGFDFSTDEFLYWLSRSQKEAPLLGGRPDFDSVMQEYSKAA